jgi:hypothetical protein
VAPMFLAACAAVQLLAIRRLHGAEFRDSLFRRVLLRSWLKNALLPLGPTGLIFAQVMDAFEGASPIGEFLPPRRAWELARSAIITTIREDGALDSGAP